MTRWMSSGLRSRGIARAAATCFVARGIVPFLGENSAIGHRLEFDVDGTSVRRLHTADSK